MMNPRSKVIDSGTWHAAFLDLAANLPQVRVERGTERGGLIFNFSEGLSVAVTQHNEAAKCLCVDDAKDKMYFIREGSR